MAAAVHVIDAGPGASALLACAVRLMSEGDGCPVVALGDSAGRAMLARGGLRVQSWASAPCGMLRFAARPLSRALRAACGDEVPASVTCWSADAGRAGDLARCVRRAHGRASAHAGRLDDAAAALRGTALAGMWEGDSGPAAAAAAAQPTPEGAGALSRHALRDSIGAKGESVVVVGAADAPRLANAGRMLDVVGRAILAGADAHLLLPDCMPNLAGVLRYARGLGLDPRVHVIAGADWPMPWWRAADAVLVTDGSEMAGVAAGSMGIRAVHAPGCPGDESVPERRSAAAAARDLAASSIVSAARERRQSAMNASAASA